MKNNALKILLAVIVQLSSFSVTTQSHAEVANPMNMEFFRKESVNPRVFSEPGSRTHVVMLGTGHPLPNPNHGGPGIAIIVDGIPYIVDAGEGIMRNIASAASAHGGKIASALNPRNLSKVFITHLHSDHVIGLPGLLLMPWVMYRSDPLEVWGPPGTSDMMKHIRKAYVADIDERTNGLEQLKVSGSKVISHEISSPGVVYQDDRIKFEAVAIPHAGWKHSYAYRITTVDRTIVISGDGVPSKTIVEASRGVDLLFHEVATEDNIMDAPWGGATKEEKGRTIWKFHTSPKQLAEMANEAKPGILVLYHEQNWSDPFDPEANVKEVRRYGYKGRIISAKDTDAF